MSTIQDLVQWIVNDTEQLQAKDQKIHELTDALGKERSRTAALQGELAQAKLVLDEEE